MKKKKNKKKRILIFVGLKAVEIICLLAFIFVPYKIGGVINPYDVIGIQWATGVLLILVALVVLYLLFMWVVHNWVMAGKMSKK